VCVDQEYLRSQIHHLRCSGIWTTCKFNMSFVDHQLNVHFSIRWIGALEQHAQTVSYRLRVDIAGPLPIIV